MSGVKILVVCHKNTALLKSKILLPIQVGTALGKEKLENMLADDTGENISEKNPMYCELTAQYWAWKNLEADYYGFFHYRRYLNFSDRKYKEDRWGNVREDALSEAMKKKYALSDDKIETLVRDYDLIISEEKNVVSMPGKAANVYEQYKYGDSLHIEDLECISAIVKEKYPDYAEDLDVYLKGKYTCFCNMYIMKKELFHEYMEWLFSILFEFEKRADMHDYSVEGRRTPGHLGERLLTLYYIHLKRNRNLKIKSLQTVIVFHTETKRPVSVLPAFEEQNIAVAFACNDKFVPYMATLLVSICECSSSKYNYDILILTQNISEKNKEILKKMIKNRSNFSIRYLDPTSYIQGCSFYIRGHFSVETYFRLVLPELLPAYQKILYLDSDMVVESDVAELYNENIESFLLGACHDADTAGLYNGYEPNKKAYMDQVLKLKKPYMYFQAGTLLMNLEEFRKVYTVEEKLKYAASQKFQLLDQDILNKLCEGSVRYLDMAWNMMVDYAGIRKNQIVVKAPAWLNEMYLEARKKPKIIHYAGSEKPWYHPEMDFGETFWNYARKTPYYEELVRDMALYSIREAEEKCKWSQKIVGGIRCVKEHGVRYTVKYILKK